MYVNGLNGYWLVVGAKNKQQWGYLSFSAVVTAQKVITYQIALSEIALPVAIAIAESYGNDAGLAINNDCMGNHYSSCEFNVISYGTQRCVGIIFVVIGKQQWGYITESSSATDYRLFPVSFTTECFAVCTGSSQRQDNVSVWVNEIDTIKFIVGIGENYTAMPQKNIFYIACGKQQWGYTIESNGQEDYKYFPVSYNSQCYAMALPLTYNPMHFLGQRTQILKNS